jgi:hypothetical protein
VIGNDNEVKNAEQGQYQRYPSKGSLGGVHIREERKCERGRDCVICLVHPCVITPKVMNHLKFEQVTQRKAYEKLNQFE